MTKTLFITGSTDGIGKLTAETLLKQGHKVILHGRNSKKLEAVKAELERQQPAASIYAYTADLSDLQQVDQLAVEILNDHKQLDVLVNNAGVYKVPNKNADNGIDVRFVVNTIAPYLLTSKLQGILGASGRVVNLSSAAQASVDVDALGSANRLSDDQAYAQSKLALTMWSCQLGRDPSRSNGLPSIIAVNPASFLGSNMVKEAYGMQGKDLQIGADILVRASLSDEFESASGMYFDNDKGAFSQPHPDALDRAKNEAVINKIEQVLAKHASQLD